MKRTFIPQHLTARSATFAGILILAAASMSHAQTGTAEPGNIPAPEPHDSKATQAGSGNSAGGQENAPPKKDDHVSDQGAAGAPSKEECTAQEADACEKSAPEQRSLLRRIMKVLYGPDRPPGPDPDVDTNISAGGAGGG